MKRTLTVLSFAGLLFLTTGCASEFNRVFKSSDFDYRYEYAKQCFATGKYSHAENLLIDLINFKKGSEDAEEGRCPRETSLRKLQRGGSQSEQQGSDQGGQEGDLLCLHLYAERRIKTDHGEGEVRRT
jgi:hypothetical protein